MVMIKTIMKSKVMMRMRKVRVILMIEFLPRRGPSMPTRSGTSPRRNKTEKKAAKRVTFQKQ